MNVTSLRSSQSSYGDPKYLSSISMGSVPPPSRILVDGYKNALDSIQDERPRYNPLNPSHPRSSVLLNASDPVVMHLLTETAMGDSMQFEVLSFEEVEDLKKELSFLSNRIEASKRKLALEMKLQEAAMSISRLNRSSSNGKDNGEVGPDGSPKSQRRRLSLFNRGSWGDSQQQRPDSELALSTRKCEELAQELWKLERRATDLRRRLLEHTAGVLQMTHKGLKKKSAQNTQRGSENSKGMSNGRATSAWDEFDDRSLYKTAEHLDDIGANYNRRLGSHQLDDASRELNGETEEKLEGINSRLDEILRNAGSSRTPTMMFPPGTRRNVPDQLAYLEANIDDTQRRFENLTDQKTILTTQIQQQRDLNSKSDAQRDEHIGNLTQEIARLKEDLDLSQREAENTRNELSLVIDQLDAARQESMLREQKRSSEENASAKKEDLLAKEEEIKRLEALIAELHAERDLKVKEAVEAREQAEKEVNRLQSEYAELESDMIRIQTELTMVRAELDGAYGSRAERAAEAAANPAIQKEIEDLHQRNISLTEELSVLRAEQLNNSNAGHSELQQRVQMLEKELRDTIDDYESMTKASIEFEKEREKLEGTIDNLRERCEGLETQMSDGRIQALGNSAGGTASETTSTTVLKNEFKKMMRDTRAENMRALKAEQEERRRLEALVRSLKKEQTAGKSNLSQSTSASAT